MSEQDAIQDLAIQRLKPGDVVTAVIKNVVHFGAFAIIKDPETGDFNGGTVSFLVRLLPALMWLPVCLDRNSLSPLATLYS